MGDTKYMKFISFDFETTGLKSQKHAITELAFIKFDGDKVVDKLVSLINPEQFISAKITGITGITNEMVADKPNFKDLAPQISDFIGNDLLVAYNAGFDKSFLNVGFYKAGIHKHFNPLACTMALTIAGKRLGGWPIFAEALQLWQIKTEGNNFHRAEFDAYHNGLLFYKITELVDPKILANNLKQLKIPSQKYNPSEYAEYVKIHGEPKKFVPYQDED